MTIGWEKFSAAPLLDRWRALCVNDEVLRSRLPGAQGRFAVIQSGFAITITFSDAMVGLAMGSEAETRFIASGAIWDEFLKLRPARHHHHLYALRMRVPEFSAEGDELTWAQHAHLLRRVFDLARWTLTGASMPAPASLSAILLRMAKARGRGAQSLGYIPPGPIHGNSIDSWRILGLRKQAML
ncbi:MAG: hypothetical protein LW713_11060 [Acetobacteraceae bacterium]|nr:hypothetical protein [Acetobacteraceae bacterium]